MTYYIELVNSIVSLIMSKNSYKIGNWLNDDLVSDGILAAYKASFSYDGSMEYHKYVRTKIYYAVYECLRSQPFSPSRDEKKMEREVREFGEKLPRLATVPIDGFEEIIPSDEDVYQIVERKNLLERLLPNVNKRVRFILYKYFYEGFELNEIGDILGVSEARVCQLKNNGLQRLRKICVEDCISH